MRVLQRSNAGRRYRCDRDRDQAASGDGSAPAATEPTTEYEVERLPEDVGATHVAFGCNVTDATYRNIVATAEFVVNVLPESLTTRAAMDAFRR